MLHWDPSTTRTRGLGENLKQVSCTTLFVSDLEESVRFYNEILHFKLLEKDEASATFDAKNMVIMIKVGTPIAFSGENLIVGHISVDVEDVAKAFDYLHVVDVPFEINVSVPKGAGRAASEGGDLTNTVGQAFLRDPDGYYYEICNCHLLTDFVLGKKTNFSPGVYKEDNPDVPINMTNVRNMTVVSFSVKLAALAARTKKKKQADPTDTYRYIKPLPPDKQPKEVDPVILENLISRKCIYGNICQSFSDEELKEILLQAGNNAPTAIVLMQQRIDSGEVTRIYKPPSYYVNGIAEDLKYDPAALVAGADEKGKGQPAPKITAGSRAVKRRKQCDRVPEAAEFDITSVNHIAFIVSDVGKATDFCADVLGLQQVRRPDFDRHGAWFTGGNLEIHLILGNPLAPDRSIEGPDANSVSFKVEDLALAKDVLAKKYAADKSIMLEVESSACYVRDPDGYVFKIHE